MSPYMTSTRQTVVDAIVEICGLSPDQLVDGATLESLGIDSMDMIEIGMMVEQAHDTQIDVDDFADVQTLGDAVATFDRLVGS
jgi:acyl carrier protein